MNLESFDYENGFKMIHQKSMHRLPLCSIYVFCNVGSSNETDQLRGIAHYLEHLIFQSSQYKNVAKLYEQYDKMGTQINAYTTKRYTCFYVKCPDDYSKEILSIFSSMLYDTDLSPSRIQKERAVILEENVRSMDDETNRVEEAFESKIYQHSSFEEPIDNIRYQEANKKIDYKTLLQWYKWFYVPSNMVMSIVSNKSGSFWHNALQTTRFVKQPVSTVRKPKNASKPWSDLSYQSKIEYVVTEDSYLASSQIIIGYRTVSHYSDKQHIFVLLSHILNGMGGRLFKALRQQESLVYNVNSVVECSEYTGYFSIQTECRPKYMLKDNKGKKQGVIHLIMKIFHKLYNKGITEKELAIGKERLLSSLKIDMEDIGKISKYNGEMYLIHHNDSKESTHNRKQQFVSYEDQYKAYYESISLEQVNYAIREYFQVKNMVVSILSSKSPSLKVLKQICEKMPKGRKTRKNLRRLESL